MEEEAQTEKGKEFNTHLSSEINWLQGPNREICVEWVDLLPPRPKELLIWMETDH